MNQPPAPSAAPVAASTPAPIQSAVPVLPTNPRNWKKIILIVLAAVLGIAVLAGVYFLGVSTQSKKDAAALNTSIVTVPSQVPTPSPIPRVTAGFTKAQGLMNQGGKTIIRSVVQISYSGVLTAVDPGKSWTVEKGGDTVVIHQEGNQQVQYSLFKSQNSAAQPANSIDLGVGDTVTITSFVDPITGAASVVAISFFKKG